MQQPLCSLSCTCKINITLLFGKNFGRGLSEMGEEKQQHSVHHPASRCRPGRQREFVKPIQNPSQHARQHCSNSLVVKHQTANLGTQVRFLGCCTPTQGINWEAGGVGMPNATMCSRRPLVPSDKLLLTRLDSDFDQTPKDLLT